MRGRALFPEPLENVEVRSVFFVLCHGTSLLHVPPTEGYHGDYSSLLELCAQCIALCVLGCQLLTATCDAIEIWVGASNPR